MVEEGSQWSAVAGAGGGRGGRSSPSRRIKSQQSVKTDGGGSSGGRRTPMRDHITGGQKLFTSPTSNRGHGGGESGSVHSTQTTPVYGEPPRSSGNINNKYSPHSGRYSSGGQGGGGGGTYYGSNMMDHQKQQQLHQQHQSKLPHGLTVQELKEMTRARLAAEAEGGQPLDDDKSIYS